MQVMRVTSPLHTSLYRVFGGRVVGRLAANCMPVLLPTTVGRRTQQPHTAPVGFARDGNDFVVMGSNGGLRRSPGWGFNLQAILEADVIRLRVVPAGG